jgi:5-methylcytosine-specific restriction endonuclease McrA
MAKRRTDTAYLEYPPHMLRRTYLSAMRQGKVFDCGICHKPIEKMYQLTIDHIIPKSKGGSHEYENLQAAHKRCNGSKGNTEPVLEFITWRPGERPESLHNDSAYGILTAKA